MSYSAALYSPTSTTTTTTTTAPASTAPPHQQPPPPPPPSVSTNLQSSSAPIPPITSTHPTRASASIASSGNKPSPNTRARSSTSRTGDNSVSPSRTAAPTPPAASTRSSRRSQSSKSPEKMQPATTTTASSTAAESPKPPLSHIFTNGHASTANSEGEPELDDGDQYGGNDGDEAKNEDGNVDGTNGRIVAADNADRAALPAAAKPPNKIKLVISRKHWADDSLAAVSSSEAQTPEPSTTPPTGTKTTDAASTTSEAAGTATAASVVEQGAPPAVTAVPDSTRAETAAHPHKASSDQTLPSQSGTADAPSAAPTTLKATAATTSTPAAVAPTTTGANTTSTQPPAENRVSSTANATAAPTEASTPVPDDKPKRQPRKKRKWLKRGEVDPDDPEAVAQQKKRHQLIDAALALLDEHEQRILDETDPELLELQSELERRFKRKVTYLDALHEAQQAELKHARDLEVDHHKFQFRADCEDLATKMTFELARKRARLSAEKVFHDSNDGRPSSKRMYTNMPMLGEGRGCGGWWRVPNALLSDKSEETQLIVKEGIMRKRRRILMGPRPASQTDIMDDLIELGLREAPESSPEPESVDDAESELPDMIDVDMDYHSSSVVAISPPPPVPQPLLPVPAPARARGTVPEPISAPPPRATPTPTPLPPPSDLHRSPPGPTPHDLSPTYPFHPPPPHAPQLVSLEKEPLPAPGPSSSRYGPPPPDRRWDGHERRPSLRPPPDDRPLDRPLDRPMGDRPISDRPLPMYPPPRESGFAYRPHRPPTYGAPPPPGGPPPPSSTPYGYRDPHHDPLWYQPPPPAGPSGPPRVPPQTATATGPPPPPQPPTATLGGDPFWARDTWRPREYYSQRPRNTRPPGWGDHAGGSSAPAAYATGRP